MICGWFFHHLRHSQGGLGGFSTSVVAGSEAAHTGLLFIFQKQHFVYDWDFMLKLDLHECAADVFGDVRSVGGLATQDDAEADNGGEGGVLRIACCVRRTEP